MILRHACVLLLMVATPAVLMAQQGPLVTETEPNNSFAAAQLIPFGDTVSAYIDNHPDIDYFAVDIPAGTKFFLTIERSFCMGLGMYGPDQQTVILSRNCYSEHADTMHALIEHSGRYYFRVMHDDDRPNEVQDPPLPYKLGFGVYTAPAPGPGNPLAHVATDEGGISAMVPAPNGGVVFIDVMVDASDHQHTRLRRMTPDGRISTIASDLNPMGQIAVDAFGDVLVPSEDGVWRYSLVTGARTLFTGRSTGAFPYSGITIGADGDVWLSDPGTFEAGAVFSRFDPFGNLKEKVPIPVGRVFYLTTAQNGDVFFQTQDVGDIYRLVNNATPQRVVTASTPDAGQGSLLLDQDGWIYLPKTRQARGRLYDAQYQLARDPLAQVLDSMYWANQ